MNLVGKIFTLLIMVMSLVFMSFAVMVYATHKNWYDIVSLSREQAATENKPIGLKLQLQDATTQKNELKDQLDKMEADRQQEQLAARNNLLKVKADLDEQLKKNASLQEDLESVTKEKGQALTTLDTTAQDNNTLRGQVDTLRAAKRDAEKTRDAKMAELVEKTDNLLQAQNELNMLKERMAQVQMQLADAKLVLNKFDLKPDPKFYKGSKVKGLVLAVQGAGLLEISIGSDDGLNKGAYLRVFRADGSEYLGKAQVVDTRPDRSVCRVLRDTQKGVITKGDRVFSGINDIE